MKKVIYVILMTLFYPFLTKAQTTGLINDDFSTGSTYSWTVGIAGMSLQNTGSQLVVNTTSQNATQYAGSIKKTGTISLHAGNYPIIAVKMDKPPLSNLFLDTNIGSYNNGKNNHKKIETPTGNIYFWDLSKGTLGSTTLSTTSTTTLSMIQLKMFEIVFSQAELAASDTSYHVDWIKTFASEEDLRSYVNAAPLITYNFAGTFKHPGLLHDNADFSRMKKYIEEKTTRPYGSYIKLLASPHASSSYILKGPFKYLTRESSWVVSGTTITSTQNAVENDVNAAYYNAIMWNLTGNTAYANKSIAILDAYADTTIGVAGAAEELEGLYAFLYCNAAELMAHTYTGWAPDKIQKSKDFLKNVFYPLLQNFKPCAHGAWDAICMKTLMSIAIYTDDVTMYNKVVNYYYNGEGNGSMKNYIVSDDGQLEESNRDQGHSTLALGCLAELAEIANKQGLDLYSANTNRTNALMKGYEYTAQFNNGLSVPYITHYDYCQSNQMTDYTPESISSIGRPSIRPVWEIAYNSYVYRKGLIMPQTFTMLQSIGSEGGSNADNSAYGSLLYYLGSTPDHQLATLSNQDNDGGIRKKIISYVVKNNALELVLDGIENQNVQIEISALSGQRVYSDKLFVDSLMLQIPVKLSAGVYIVKFQHSEGVDLLKIIIVR